MAVGTRGDAVRWDGTSWSAPVLTDPAGGGLTSVSCAGPGSCVAVDFAGRAINVPGAGI